MIPNKIPNIKTDVGDFMFTLYLLTFASGKKYVGQTMRKLSTRITQHNQMARSGSMLPVHCAWRAYGKPEVSVIAEFKTHEELHAAEIENIKLLDTLAPNGYNLCHGGETAPSLNAEVAEKIRVRATGRKHIDTSPWVDATTQNWKNTEYRAKVSEGLKLSWTEEKRLERSKQSKEMWEKRKAAGWSMPEATKDKLRAKTVSKETREKMSVAAKNRVRGPVSDELRITLSLAVKKSWESPERKKAGSKISAALLARTPEQKAETTRKRLESRKRNKEAICH